MIDNYLDFVKGRRAYALREMRHCRDKSRQFQENWANGFYRGMALVWEFESRHWRTLQKDIEARLLEGSSLIWIEHHTGERSSASSFIGGKNG